MTLTELRYIVAVAQERHFGRAAQRCHVSQPTLSIAIKKLEEELALSLFDRSSNEVITTEAGGRIVAQARRVLDEADVIRQLASEEQNELDGAFKLGLIFTVAPYLLPKLILSLREIAPNMPLMLEENYTHMLTESLKRGDLDAIIVAEPFQETGLLTEPLYDEPFFVIVPKGHPFEELDAVTQHELAQEQVLLLTEGNCMRDNVLAGCNELAAWPAAYCRPPRGPKSTPGCSASSRSPKKYRPGAWCLPTAATSSAPRHWRRYVTPLSVHSWPG